MGEIQTQIRTPRLTLRAPRGADAPIVADRINDLEVVRMLTGVPYPYAIEDAYGFIEAVGRKDADREQTFVMDHVDFGVIGVIGFHTDASDAASRPELGYWLGRTFWRRGFATEAACALLRWTAESWGRHAVSAGHFADNPASGEVLCKAGFLYTGEVRMRVSSARDGVTPTRMMIWLS